MVGAGQGVLDAAEYRIGPSRFRVLGSGLSAVHHHRPINAAGGGDARNAGQPIEGDASAGVEMLPRPSGGFAETEALSNGELSCSTGATSLWS